MQRPNLTISAAAPESAPTPNPLRNRLTTPLVAAPTPLVDWADPSQWDRQTDTTHIQTPLTGYGRGELFAQENDFDSASESDTMSRQGSSNAWKIRTESEIITEQLHHQGQSFPPPPPPTCPPETRRSRAELWSRSAQKWDITCTLPLPPRSPLDGMDEEVTRRVAPMTLVPYRGDQWLLQSQHWFAFVQKNFKYPDKNKATLSTHSFISSQCAL